MATKTVTLTPLTDYPDASVSARITVQVDVMREGQLAEGVGGDSQISSTAASFTFPINDLPADCYNLVTVMAANVQPLARTVLAPATAGPFLFADLIDVDPSTLTPVTPGSNTVQLIAAEAALRVAGDAAILAQKGSPSGIAPLDADSRVPYENLPELGYDGGAF